MLGCLMLISVFFVLFGVKAFFSITFAQSFEIFSPLDFADVITLMSENKESFPFLFLLLVFELLGSSFSSSLSRLLSL